MKGKQMLMIWGAAAAMMLAACSKEAVGPDAKGKGSLHISAVTMPQISVNDDTRATGDEIPLSDIVGGAASDFTEDWVMTSMRTRVARIDIETDQESYVGHADKIDVEEFDVGEYNITMGSTTENRKKLPPYIVYTQTNPDGKSIAAEQAPAYRKDNPEEKLIPEVAEGEGANYIYFEGVAAPVTVEFNKETKVPITVKVANTVVTAEFTPAFRNYFANGATVRLTTKAATDKVNPSPVKDQILATYTGSGAVVQHYYWVRPQEFTLTAVATPQDPSPGHIAAEQIPLNPVTRPTANVNPQTLYRFVYDVTEDAGSGAITITVNDEPIGTVNLGEVETNPGADGYEGSEEQK